MTFDKIIIKIVMRNLKTYIGYLLSSIFSVATFFIFSMIYYHSSFSEFSFFKEIIYVITIFFIVYFLKLFIKSKKKDLGILLILGMNKNQVRKILIIENIVIGSLAIIIGIIFGVVFLKFFLIIISGILEIKEIKFYFSIQIVLITVIRYLVLFAIIPVVIAKSLKFKSIIELINYKKEEITKIKVSLIKSIISSVIILGGIFLVITSNKNNILTIRLLLILGLFVFGNYLFFFYIINYMVYLVSKIKKIYLTKINFLFISNLKYRLHDNINMFFIVTILLAVSFTSIGAVYIQKSVLKTDSIKRSPFSFNYLVKDYFKYDKDELFIDNTFKKNNVKYNKIKINILQSSKNQNNQVYRYNFIKESEYNKVANLINRPMVKLKRNEAMIVPNYEQITEIEKKTIGKKIKISEEEKVNIKGNVEGCFAFKGILLNTLIISNEDFDKVYKNFNKNIFIGYEVENWEKIKKLTEQIEQKSKSSNANRQPKSFLITRIYEYKMQKKTNSVMLYFVFFVGSILYLAAISFVSYKFYMELKQQQNKYVNMISLGLTFKELKKIISREMMVIFFIPYIIATIDCIFAYRILYIIYGIPIYKPILEMMITFFIINLIYFLIWRFKNINFLCFK